MKKAATKTVHLKREFKKEISGKLQTVLAELKNILSEEEFQQRLKKAAKVLTHGLHGKDFQKEDKPAGTKIKQAAPEIKGAKKAKALKKAALKKAEASK